ncbi:MAG TPA: sigma-70 family RNA polymerase sigma factor [Candidatus Sulfotelmatobacter sp.]|jgi:RNA polymerase sigma factor (sigma-70 family)|nr:sigma-70 family RNA polymerase sigma factor [Candidatus Sulfotelmatobacter sp.]
MTTDCELLATFARTNSEDAFAEVVKRHVNLVYSAALRQAGGDVHLAKDVAQSVFTDLARKAASLSRRENLSGWLYTSAHFAAAKIVRTETRRRDREEKFMRESEHQNSAGTPPTAALENEWQQVSAVLDAAMHELKETDRDAILLRYFENRPFAEVGAKLGLNENAARMRVDRAVEKLRAIFGKRGLATTTSLAPVISANAIQLAPANLAASLTTTAISSVGTGITLFKIMTATKIKIAFATLVAAGVVAAIVMQHQAQEKLRGDNAALQEQLAQLQSDNQSLSNRLASAGDSKKLSVEQFKELLKLRGEAGVLRNQTTDLDQDNAALKKRLANISGAETNQASVPPQVHIKARFIDVPIDGFATPEAAANGLTGILTYQEFTNEWAILEKREGVVNLGEPEVTTTSGRQTQMRATSVITVITNYAFVESNEINGVNALVPQTAQVETGPIIDVFPQVLSDGHTVSLPVTASDTEFLGYADPTNKTVPAYTKSGEEVDVPQLDPRFQTLETSTKANVWDNQTLVFQPTWKQDPGDAFLQSTNNPVALKTMILVFITATIIDPAGNRVYEQDETNSIPDQPVPASVASPLISP